MRVLKISWLILGVAMSLASVPALAQEHSATPTLVQRRQAAIDAVDRAVQASYEAYDAATTAGESSRNSGRLFGHRSHETAQRNNDLASNANATARDEYATAAHLLREYAAAAHAAGDVAQEQRALHAAARATALSQTHGEIADNAREAEGNHDFARLSISNRYYHRRDDDEVSFADARQQPTRRAVFRENAVEIADENAQSLDDIERDINLLASELEHTPPPRAEARPIRLGPQRPQRGRWRVSFRNR
jgi:hypothetical protein